MRALQVQLTSAAAEGMKETPMYKTYVALAPKVEDFPRLIGIHGLACAVPQIVRLVSGS